MTTIYTQNARGRWRRPRDTNGDIIVDASPDLTKLEYIIDYIHALGPDTHVIAVCQPSVPTLAATAIW